MNEIKKMYENIGIGKKVMCEWTCKDSPDCNANCKHYGSTQLYYPPFTAEKQLELIKWLSKNKNGFGLFDDGTEGLSCHCDFHWEWFRRDFYAEDFDNALAGLINSLWQDLTEEEKQQIRETLK